MDGVSLHTLSDFTVAGSVSGPSGRRCPFPIATYRLQIVLQAFEPVLHGWLSLQES